MLNEVIRLLIFIKNQYYWSLKIISSSYEVLNGLFWKKFKGGGGQGFTQGLFATTFFFLIETHSMQGWTAPTRHGVTRK